MLRKSPLAPLFPPGQKPYGLEAKEGYKSTFVLLEPITEGLRFLLIFACKMLFYGLCLLFPRAQKDSWFHFVWVTPVRNSSGALNPALRGGTPYGSEPGIILKSNPGSPR
jgi:hypothetical protein